MAQEVHVREKVIGVNCFLGEAPVEAVVPESSVVLNFSVIMRGEIAKLGGISEGNEWRGWMKSWVMVSWLKLTFGGGVVVRRRKSHGWSLALVCVTRLASYGTLHRTQQVSSSFPNH